MNIKILTVSLLAVLGLAGGAYTVMNTDIMDNPELTELNLSQYIPEFIAGLIGIEKTDVFSDEIDTSPSFTTDEQVEADPFVEEVEQVEEVEEELVVENTPIEEEVIKEVEIESQEQLLTSNNTTPSKLDGENVSMQIQAANSEIYKLDIENKELEMLFQKILKQNRSLAEELRELDEKIAAIN